MNVHLALAAGTTIYSSDRRHGGSEEPVGGVVVEIIYGDPYDDGLFRRQVLYRVIDHRRLRPDLRIDMIHETEVGDTEESPTQRLRILVRRLCQEVAMDGYKPRTGAMTAREADCVRWAWALMRAMGGPDAGR